MINFSTSGPYTLTLTVDPIRFALPPAATVPTVSTVSSPGGTLDGIAFFDSWAWQNRKLIVVGTTVGVGLLMLGVASAILR